MKVEKFAEAIKQVIINQTRMWGGDDYPIEPNKGYKLTMHLVHKGESISITLPILEEIKPQEGEL